MTHRLLDMTGMRIWAALATVAVLAGCGATDRPDLAEVQGTVTLDGKPLAGATVVFEPTEGGRASRGQTDAQGKYELIYLRDIKGAKIGPHRVSITTASEENLTERLPAKYHRQTTLSAQVDQGENTCNFDLKSQ